MTRLPGQSIVLDLSLPDIGDAAYSLALGTLFFFAGVGVLGWLYGQLRFALEGLTTLFGVVVLTLLAFLLFAYGWSFLARGLTAIIAAGVREGTAPRD